MKATALDQGLELATKFLYPRYHGNGARITEHADRLARHLLGNVEQGVEILHRSLPVANSLHDLGRPRRALAALRALRAALVSKEAGDPGDDRDHRLRIVDDDHAP